VRDGDRIRIVVDRQRLEGSVDLLGQDGTVESGTRLLAERSPRADLRADEELPAETKLWAALQEVSGGPWGGAVYDVDAILRVIEAGRRALGMSERAAESEPR
jgi:dihydroxyacid dehydratase/phosphogluconate dehydratase